MEWLLSYNSKKKVAKIAFVLYIKIFFLTIFFMEELYG